MIRIIVTNKALNGILLRTPSDFVSLMKKEAIKPLGSQNPVFRGLLNLSRKKKTDRPTETEREAGRRERQPLHPHSVSNNPTKAGRPERNFACAPI